MDRRTIMKNILMLASEAVPFIKTGGLADVVGSLPKTIDNDLWGTDMTFGFQSAVNIATTAIDQIHTTASSHGRVFIVEIMGHKFGWLPLNLKTLSSQRASRNFRNKVLKLSIVTIISVISAIIR